MLDILKAMLNLEREMVFKARAKKHFAIRISTIVCIIFAIQYLLSPIDLIPEALIKPRICGYIDDLVVIIISAYVTYLDIGGELIGDKGVQHSKVQKSGKPVRKTVVSNADRPAGKDVHNADTTVDMHSSISPEELVGSIDSSSDTGYNDYSNGGSDLGDDFLEESEDDEYRL